MTGPLVGDLGLLIDKRKVDIVKRMLKSCADDLKTLIAEGKDSDAKDLATAVIEIYIKIPEGENQQLPEIFAKLIADVYETESKGRFMGEFLNILDKTLVTRWASAVRRKDEAEFKYLGMASAALVLATVQERQEAGVETPTSIFGKSINMLLTEEQPGMKDWFLDNIRAQVQAKYKPGDERLAGDRIKCGLAILFGISRSGKHDYPELQEEFVKIGVEHLEAARRADFLHKMEDIVREMVRYKLNDSRDESELKEFEGQGLRIIDEAKSTVRASDLRESLENIEQLLEATAKSIHKERCG